MGLTGDSQSLPSAGEGTPLFPRQVLSLAWETLLQGRGLALWAVFFAGGAVAIGAGCRLPGAGDGQESLAPLLFYCANALLFSGAALAAGAHGLAGDRASGLRDMIGSKPISGAAWFLGRFFGLALRFSAGLLLFTLAGGGALSLLEGGRTFLQMEEPSSFAVAGLSSEGEAPRLVPPDGTSVCWTFDGDDPSPAAGELRFSLRARYPREKTFQETVPLRIVVSRGGCVLLERNIALLGRKEFSLFPVSRPLPPVGAVEPSGPLDVPSGPLEVSMSISGGHNYFEASPSGCRFVRGAGGPVSALLTAVLSFLPVLWSCLGLALLFSAVVSEPTALLASGVIVLITLSGPALEKDFRMLALGGSGQGGGHDACCRHESAGEEESAGEGEEERGGPSLLLRSIASLAGKILSLLPDTRVGGGSAPLSRGECPCLRDVTLSWREGIPHLLVILLLGSLLTSWRRP